MKQIAANLKHDETSRNGSLFIVGGREGPELNEVMLARSSTAEAAMRLVAFDEAPAVRASALPLSESEKAMLFDLALSATGLEPDRKEVLQAAPLIDAFARAYVAIRDREDGLI